MTPPPSELILYQTQDGQTRVQCRFEGDTLWLSQAQIAALFQKSVRTISEHLVNIYAEGELASEATVRNFRIVQIEGSRQVSREIEHYSLQAILAVGYRVRSRRGTQFRQWVTSPDCVHRAALGGRIVARAPSHLGDGVMALPALRALAQVAGQLTIAAPGFGAALYHDLPAELVPARATVQGDVAVLFAPSLRAAWQARHCTHRVGVPSDWRSPLLTVRVVPGVHRTQTYARLAQAVGATPKGDPTYVAPPGTPMPTVPAGHVGVNPVSPSGEVVMWRGFAKLAARTNRPVVVYGGPGEHQAVRRAVPTGHHLVGLPLAQFALALRHCAVFVSNDSGAAHLARACGVPTVVVHGSTTAARTGPLGSVAVEGPDLPCRPCYRKRCRYQLECMGSSVEAVEAAVATLLARHHG